MKRKTNGKLLALGALLSGLLLLTALGQAKEGKEGEGMHQEWKAKLAKELKLSPEKEAKFVALAEKYANSRKQIFENAQKANEELTKALAAEKPDEGKIKELVKSITENQDKQLTSFKDERNEEMALLSPLEQGRYLMILHKWRQEMYAAHGMMEHKKEKMMEHKKEMEKPAEKAKPEKK